MSSPRPVSPSPRPVATPPAAKRPPAGTPAPNSPKPASGGESVLGPILKIVAVAALLGGVGWFAYRQTHPETVPVEPPPHPPIDTPEIPDTAPPPPPPVVKPTEPVAPPPVVPEPPPVVVDTPKVAPLAAFGKLATAEGLAAFLESTRARFQDGRWADHLAATKTAALATLADRRKSDGPGKLDDISKNGGLPLAIAQLSLAERLGDAGWAEWVKADAAFAQRILADAPALEKFTRLLVPEDRVRPALDLWSMLDAKEKTPADKTRFLPLALAVAVVYDSRTAEDGVAMYDYFRAKEDKRKLYGEFEKLPPEELVWVVGENTFPLEDFEWAQKKLTHKHAALGSAYGQVPYVMNHAPYPAYTMEHILKMGGVCEQQARFSSANARAHGVPAAYLSGEGSRGGHAWLGFLGPKGWTTSTGRYSDGYSCGHTPCPQSGKSFREWDLFLFDLPSHRNGDYLAARRIVAAAQLLGASGDAEGRRELLAAAAQRDKASPDIRKAHLTALLDDKVELSVDAWQKIVNEYRIQMKKFPDHLDIADRIEIERIFPKQDPGRVGEMLALRRRQLVREHPGRFDLLGDSVRREAEFHLARKDGRRVGLLFNNAFREFGTHLPTYLRLAEDFTEFAKENKEVRGNAIAIMESLFLKSIDSKGAGDAFRLPMEARVAKKLAEVFAADGNEKKAEKYAARGDEIQKLADKKRADMR